MVLHALYAIQAPLLQPHPPEDAVTPGGKLAKASLRGEEQDEGSCARSLLRKPWAYGHRAPPPLVCVLAAALGPAGLSVPVFIPFDFMPQLKDESA
ncbi:MAG: hypothetical protein WAM63_19740 [Rhodomicrobium sp.]